MAAIHLRSSFTQPLSLVLLPHGSVDSRFVFKYVNLTLKYLLCVLFVCSKHKRARARARKYPSQIKTFVFSLKS